MRQKYQTIILFFIVQLLFIGISEAGAQDGTFTAAANPNPVAAAEQFQLTFTFSGSDVNSIRNFKPPGFNQFVVISGPNQTTSMQWVNGSMSASLSYVYTLYARQPGKYTIGAATIELKGKILSSNSLTIEVTQGKPKRKKQPEQQEMVNVGDNLFIRVSVDKSRVRQGEQLTATFRLYTRLSVVNFELAKAPAFEGFWGEDFDLPKQPAITTETVNGKQYRVVLIKKTALFATQAGDLKITPLEVRCAVQVQTRRQSSDPFDTFFNDPFFQQMQTANVTIKSNPLNITVDPLPANAPAGFSGAIGRFTFNASVDKQRVKAGDPITLKLTVAGSGNITLLTLPKPQLPADIESYEPKISDDISREGGVIRGKKTAEYLLIPRNAGQRFISPMQFAYYDLDRREYVTLKSPQFNFTIDPGKDFSGAIGGLAAKENVRMLGEDIRFLKLSIGTLRRVEETSASDWFWFGIVIPPFLFIGAWVYRKRMEHVYGDMPKLLFETAGREASKRLKKARQILEQGNTESYNAEILKAITEYLEHKLRTSKAEFSMEQAAVQLARHGVLDEIVQKLKTCVERAEFARYAPGSDTKGARKELLDVAAEVIGGIDATFNKRGKR
jgi:hypothetical protein